MYVYIYTYMCALEALRATAVEVSAQSRSRYGNKKSGAYTGQLSNVE